MTSSLQERLHHLADQVEVGADPVVGRDVWIRGRRYQRTRRVGTLAIVAVTVLLVVGTGTLTWQRSAPSPVPVTADAPAGLPSRVHEPSRWLPGTAEDGPLGRLIAVLPADRGTWTGSSAGTVGISAATGEYRFLDLPDQSDDTEVALAPDGRHLAYWLTGPTADTPNTNGDYQEVSTGVAVYDTLTGEAVRHQIETAHGIGPSFLAWVDSDTLVLDHTQNVGGDDDSVMDQSSGRLAPMLWWDLGQEPRLFPQGDEADLYSWGPSIGGRAVALGSDSDLHVVEGDREVRHQPSGGSLDVAVAPDPTGRWISAVWAGDGRTPNRVIVARLQGDARPLDYSMLSGSDRSFRVLGWSDPRHVMVERRVGSVRACLCLGVFEMDVKTGTSEVVVELPEGAFYAVDWATDLLDAPVVDRPAPPTPLDPRATTGLLVATLVGAAIALVLWRRRVRP